MTIAAVTATLVLGACTPPAPAVQESSATPMTTTQAEPSSTATPYSMDDY